MPRKKPEEPVRWRVTYHRCFEAFPPRYDDVRVARPIFADGRLGPCTVQMQTLEGIWGPPPSHQWRQVALRLARALEVEHGNTDLLELEA